VRSASSDPTVPSLSELLEVLCVVLRAHPHSARTAESRRLRWDSRRRRLSAECALAADGRSRRAWSWYTYVYHDCLGVKPAILLKEACKNFREASLLPAECTATRRPGRARVATAERADGGGRAAEHAAKRVDRLGTARVARERPATLPSRAAAACHDPSARRSERAARTPTRSSAPEPPSRAHRQHRRCRRARRRARQPARHRSHRLRATAARAPCTA
jgi:hypothetical protein